jgi:hypothetical protein
LVRVFLFKSIAESPHDFALLGEEEYPTSDEEQTLEEGKE